MIQLNVVALMPKRFNAGYAATKTYVLSLTQSLTAEVGEMADAARGPGLSLSSAAARYKAPVA
jgi:short-subunit dehydrogenase